MRGGGSKMALFADIIFFMDEPVSHNLSRNLAAKMLSRSWPQKLWLAENSAAICAKPAVKLSASRLRGLVLRHDRRHAMQLQK